jgi:hypothetical protein
LTIGLLETTTLASSVAAAYLISKRPRRGRERYLQGTKMQASPIPMEPSEDAPFLWGGRFLPFSLACKHFLTVGSTGSGKTILISLLMRSVLQRITNPDSADARALVYDAKTDVLSILRGMGLPDEQILVLNPFDSRVTAWHMAGDITNPFQADDVAAVFIPPSSNDANPYFDETARRFLTAIIEVFIERAGDQWTLRDLVLATSTSRRLKSIILSSPQTRDLREHFDPPKTFANVNASLNGHLRKFRSVAAIWHNAAERKFTIKDWLTSRQVLVLGNSPEAREPVQRLNSLLFTEITKALLSKSGRATSENWMFLDEFGDLGALNNLVELMKLGRSKGAAVVLGTQDIADIDDVYGKDRSRTILGNAQNLGFVHINSSQPETQRWASDVLGDLRFVRDEYAESHSRSYPAGSSSTRSVSHRHVSENLWLPSMFASRLPPTDDVHGLTGLFRVGSIFFEQHLPPNILFGDDGKWNRVPEPDPSFPHFVEHKSRQVFTLPDWDLSDCHRLGLMDVPGILDPDSPEDVGRPPGEDDDPFRSIRQP